MTISQLGIYKRAALHLGDRTLVATSDATEVATSLNAAYDNGAVDHCLAQGYWNFALRESQEDSDGTGTIGYQYYCTKPTDWVRTYNIYQDSGMNTPLLEYDDKFGKWYANQDPIYTRYISNHATLGGGLLTGWSQLFADYVAIYLARMTCERIGKGSIYDRLMELERKALLSALSKDGMDEPVKFPPVRGWATARLNYAAFQNKQP